MMRDRLEILPERDRSEVEAVSAPLREMRAGLDDTAERRLISLGVEPIAERALECSEADLVVRLDELAPARP